jgi:hypothetical protein
MAYDSASFHLVTKSVNAFSKFIYAIQRTHHPATRERYTWVNKCICMGVLWCEIATYSSVSYVNNKSFRWMNKKRSIETCARGFRSDLIDHWVWWDIKRSILAVTSSPDELTADTSASILIILAVRFHNSPLFRHPTAKQHMILSYGCENIQSKLIRSSSRDCIQLHWTGVIVPSTSSSILQHICSGIQCSITEPSAYELWDK